MSPDRARIMIADDKKVWRDDLGTIAESGGHIVVAKAGSPDEALSIIDNLNEGDVDVAFVDGNLSELSDDESDGEMIIHALKKKFPDIVAIGISSSGGVPGADYNVDKGDIDIPDFLRLVKEA